MSSGKIEIHVSGTDDLVPVLSEFIQLRKPVPHGWLAEAREAQLSCWVLVKGYHDSGTIDGVFGPYTEDYADWLLAEPLSNSYGNWTKVRLQSGPEETVPKVDLIKIDPK